MMHRVFLTNVGDEFCSDSALSCSRTKFTVQQSDSVHYSCVVYYKGGVRYFILHNLCNLLALSVDWISGDDSLTKELYSANFSEVKLSSEIHCPWS